MSKKKSYFKGLRTTIYKVADIEEAKEWYAKVFEVTPYFDEPYYVGFDIAGYELGLQPDKNIKQNKTISVTSYWGVDDINEAYNKMLAQGAKPVEEPKNVGGELMVASVKDPWGNAIGIIFNPYFKVN
jgi:lactoylglutathione lyase